MRRHIWLQERKTLLQFVWRSPCKVCFHHSWHLQQGYTNISSYFLSIMCTRWFINCLLIILCLAQNDPSAHENFLKINRAYEVLKDEDLRKKYDKYGEKGLEDQQQGGRYESWHYYRYDFGKLRCMFVICLKSQVNRVLTSEMHKKI